MITHDQTAATTPTPLKQMLQEAPEIQSLHPSSQVAQEVRGQKEEESYPAHLHQLCDHDNTEAVLLPNHPPEIIDHLLLGACGGTHAGKGGGVGGRETQKDEEGGKIRHKSEKIAAITITVEALCNPRLRTKQQCVIHELLPALRSNTTEKCHFNTPTNPQLLCKQAHVLPFPGTSGSHKSQPPREDGAFIDFITPWHRYHHKVLLYADK